MTTALKKMVKLKLKKRKVVLPKPHPPFIGCKV